MITNPNCGKHTPNKYYRKHISVLCDITKIGKQRKGKGTTSSSMESGNESLVSKTIGPTNAGKKALTMTFQIRYLFLQKLDTGIYSINGWLNSPHKKGSGNFTEVIKNKLHCRILSAETESIKLCLMLFNTHPNIFKKCSLAERPRRNSCIKLPRLL